LTLVLGVLVLRMRNIPIAEQMLRCDSHSSNSLCKNAPIRLIFITYISSA
jgi:hypothetical protein